MVGKEGRRGVGWGRMYRESFEVTRKLTERMGRWVDGVSLDSRVLGEALIFLFLNVELIMLSADVVRNFVNLYNYPANIFSCFYIVKYMARVYELSLKS